MKKNNFAFLLCVLIGLLSPAFIRAQAGFPKYSFAQQEIVPCTVDTTIMTLVPKQWIIYQTENDQWDGGLDSTVCPSVDSLGYLRYDQISIGRPVFLKFVPDTNASSILQHHTMGKVDVYISYPSLSVLDTTCTDSSCTQVVMNIDVPDTSGTGINTRNHRFRYNGFLSQTSQLIQIEGCFVTEKFVNGNSLSEFVIQVNTNAGASDSDYFRLEEVYFSQNVLATLLDSGSISYYSVAPYSYQLNYDNFVVLHQGTDYPDKDHISYLELSPAQNGTVPFTIDLELSNYAFLSYQPFTEIRGVLVTGSDSIRHGVNLIDNGGDICMPHMVEIRLREGNSFEYRSGTINFEDSRSCMMFDGGSKLTIAGGSTLSLGHGGKGILALKPGMQLNMEQNSALVIYSNLLIMENEWQKNPGQLYLTLNEGNKMTFAKGSHLNNKHSMDQQMKLHIFMNGGEIDYSNLPAEEQQLIHLIYPESDKPQSIFNVGFQNPAENQLYITFESNAEQWTSFRILDVTGKVVSSGSKWTNYGKNSWNKPLEGIEKGLYFFEITTADQKIVRKFIHP